LPRIAEIDESKIVHVQPRDPAHVLRFDLAQTLDETRRRPVVAVIQLRASEKRRLVGVRFVLQEVLGDELLDEPLQSPRVERRANTGKTEKCPIFRRLGNDRYPESGSQSARGLAGKALRSPLG